MARKGDRISAIPGSGYARTAGLIPIMIFLAIFFVGPLLVNFAQSFVGGKTIFGEYSRIFTDGYYLLVILQTILLGFAVTIGCLVLGYPLGMAIARAGGRLRAVMMFAVVAPLLVNVVVRSFGWMVILGNQGVVNWILSALGLTPVELMYTWWGICIALVHVLLPFMALSIASVLEGIDPRLDEAAKVLGANGLDALRFIVLPLSFEGVITGSILVFTAAVGSFVTIMLLGNASTMVLPLLIYQQLTVASDWAFAAAMGATLLILVATLLWIQAHFMQPKWRRTPAV